MCGVSAHLRSLRRWCPESSKNSLESPEFNQSTAVGGNLQPDGGMHPPNPSLG
jgi:hypothetical protein